MSSDADAQVPDAASAAEVIAPVAAAPSKPPLGLWGAAIQNVLGEASPIQSVVLQALVSLLCSGIVYGWPAVVFMLNSDGIYKELCEGSDLSPVRVPSRLRSAVVLFTRCSTQTVQCSARNLKYATIYNIGVAISVASYLWYGLAVDKLGPLYTNMISTTLSALGCFVFGLSSNGSFR